MVVFNTVYGWHCDLYNTKLILIKIEMEGEKINKN